MKKAKHVAAIILKLSFNYILYNKVVLDLKLYTFY